MPKKWGFIDFDNTVMGTEHLALPSMVARFNELYGDKLDHSLTLDNFRDNFAGMARESLCAAMEKHFGFPVSCDALYQDREWRIMQLYAREKVPMARHVMEAFETMIAKGITLSLVSNNPVQRNMSAMRYAENGRGEDLAAFFGTRVFESGDKQKPLPDVYTRALAQVGAEKESSFAVEDSPSGVKAAVAAGLTVYGYVGLLHDSDTMAQKLAEAGAAEVFDDWRAILSRVCR